MSAKVFSLWYLRPLFNEMRNFSLITLLQFAAKNDSSGIYSPTEISQIQTIISPKGVTQWQPDLLEALEDISLLIQKIVPTISVTMLYSQ